MLVQNKKKQEIKQEAIWFLGPGYCQMLYNKMMNMIWLYQISFQIPWPPMHFQSNWTQRIRRAKDGGDKTKNHITPGWNNAVQEQTRCEEPSEEHFIL